MSSESTLGNVSPDVAARLRPMSLGDILDQAFRLYRRHFVRLLGIVAVVSLPLALLQLVGQLLSGSASPAVPGTVPTPSSGAVFTSLLGSCITVLIGVAAVIASAFQSGAVTTFISDDVLGRSVTIRQAYARTLHVWSSLTGASVLLMIIYGLIAAVVSVPFICLLFLFSVAFGLINPSSVTPQSATGIGLLFVIPFALLFIVAVLAFVVRWLFWTQAIVVEHRSAVESLRRSWRLVKGSTLRVAVLYVSLTILTSALSLGPTLALQLVLGQFRSPLTLILSSLTSTAISTLVAPIPLSAITLLYYDLRIRKEGFDLQTRSELQSVHVPRSAGGIA